MYSDMSDSSFKLEVNGNWKLALENYLESYHLPWVHPGLNSYSKLEALENIVEYGHYSGCKLATSIFLSTQQESILLPLKTLVLNGRQRESI